MSWLTRLASVFRHYSDGRMLSYIRDWYSASQGRFGTNSSYTGLGDIIGAMGPIELIAAVFMLLSLVFAIASRKAKKKGSGHFGALCAFLTFALNAVWFAFWVRPGEEFFFTQGYYICMGMAAVTAVISLILFFVCLSHAKKAGKPADAAVPAASAPAAAAVSKPAETDEKDAQLQKEIAELERQLEEVRKQKEAFSASSSDADVRTSPSAATVSETSVSRTTPEVTAPVETESNTVAAQNSTGSEVSSEKVKKEPVPYGGKSKTVATLLSFFMGMFGVDRYYLGYGLTGFLKMMFCVVLFLALTGALPVTTKGRGASPMPVIAILLLAVWLIDLIRIASGKLIPKKVARQQKLDARKATYEAARERQNKRVDALNAKLRADGFITSGSFYCSDRALTRPKENSTILSDTVYLNSKAFLLDNTHRRMALSGSTIRPVSFIFPMTLSCPAKSCMTASGKPPPPIWATPRTSAA